MNRKLQRLSIFTGLLLAVAIVFVQLFQFQSGSTSFAKSAKTEQHESKSTNEELQICLPSFSLPSPVHVAVNLDAVCLFEIVFEDKRDSGRPAVSTLIPERFLITLFRVIIAPNAP